jgi:hypothetical protein
MIANFSVLVDHGDFFLPGWTPVILKKNCKLLRKPWLMFRRLRIWLIKVCRSSLILSYRTEMDTTN